MTPLIDTIVFNDSKTPKFGSFKHIFINQESEDEHKPVSFQLKNVKAPFGVNYQEYNNDIKSTIPLSLDDDKIVQFILEFEEKLIEVATTRSLHWFGQELDTPTIRSIFKPSLYHNNKKFHPSLTAKVSPNTIIHDENKNIVRLSSIHKGQHIHANIEVGGIWITKSSKFGISWKITQIETIPFKRTPRNNQEPNRNYAFNDDE